MDDPTYDPHYIIHTGKTQEQMDHEIALEKAKQPHTWSQAFSEAAMWLSFAAMVCSMAYCAAINL